jgi:hypothetical protein
VAFAIGLRGAGIWLPVLVAIVGVGLIGAGLFATDPVNGYPPGSSSVKTTSGSLHGLFSLLVFFGLPVACGIAVFRFAKARRVGWAVYSGLTGVPSSPVLCSQASASPEKTRPSCRLAGSCSESLSSSAGRGWPRSRWKGCGPHLGHDAASGGERLLASADSRNIDGSSSNRATLPAAAERTFGANDR